MKKLLSFLLAIILLVGTATPVLADGGNKEEDKKTIGTIAANDISKTKPEKTTVIVHKLSADSFDNTKVPAKHNGGLLKPEEYQALGTNVKPLKGVKFTYYKLKDEDQFEKLKNGKMTIAQALQAGASQAGTGKTDANGQISAELAKGYYWFEETGYEKGENGPDSISSSIAVPFGISIPVTNTMDITDNNGKTHDAGTVYLTKVHVYPKNVTGDKPGPDKDVNEINQKTANFQIGQEIDWFIKGDIPANIKDYGSYSLTDTIDSQLTYVDGSAKVYYGKFANKEAFKNAQELSTDFYTLTYEAATKTIKVELKTEERTVNNVKVNYVKDLYNSVNPTDKDYKLYVVYKTKINDTAIMGKDIPNNVTLEFTNKPGGKPEKPTIPEDKVPKVNTGGKKFKKIDSTAAKTALKDAVFVIKHQKDTKPADEKAWDKVEALKWTDDLIKANEQAIKDGKFAIKTENKEIYTATSESNKPTNGQIIYLRSNAQGEFEIKGLEYSTYTPKKWDADKKTLVDLPVVNNYYAWKEVKAPATYGLLENHKEFTIDKTSYNANPDTAKSNVGDAKPEEIINKKVTIPQTGGIGTIIFTVVGITLMAGAVMAMRKSKSEEN